MNYPHLLICLSLAFLVTPAMAVYKCKDAQGRTQFQEIPCSTTGTQGNAINIRPASGAATPPTTAKETTPTTPTEAERLRALNERSSKESRMHRMVHLEIPAARSHIRRASKKCNERMEAAKRKKALANNNLAGATWEQSISTEMQAIATQCAADQTRLNAALERLLNEQRMLEQELEQ